MTIAATKQRSDTILRNGDLALNISAVERDIAGNAHRSRLSWEFVCRTVARNAEIVGGEDQHGWRPIAAKIYAMQGGSPSVEVMNRVKNKQPVEGFAPMLLAAFKIDRSSELGRTIADAETEALKFGKRLEAQRAHLRAETYGAGDEDDGAVSTAVDPVQHARLLAAYAESGSEIPAHEVDSALDTLSVMQAHVARAGDVTQAMEKIVAAGPSANHFDAILQAAHSRGR